ncbi:Uma2 family endonuclease [Tepidiforma sp.]|uniref:Uma2 family endonuclease n=1 Tax=Tepidiforma sp. TaxID=2682230 RepID=UPI00261F754C|nr:Uma2 family endonuclease [Tepidiforma sp.]MCX7618938.1 Uma2 family endonuclease [Tepidiforma sp.]
MSAQPGPAPALLTADEFWQLPDPPHGGRLELVEGRVVEHMPVGERHGAIAAELVSVIRNFIKPHGLGRVDVETGFRVAARPDTVLAPDVAWRAAERVNAPLSDRYVEGAPTLAIEIMSPEDREADVARKIELYLDGGAERVWIVRPQNRTVTVHRPGGDAHTYSARDTLTSEDAAFPVPGFELPLAELFAEA